ncbi:MAG: phosphate signaling complex protein PhoU [Deltaproteobacteria bacterium]|nr:phosphate signaling complex protein PhoU [Deltaproteobacteria bacterium]
MSVRLQKDVEKLSQRVVALGTLVEERLRLSVKAIECRDAEMARRVIEGDIEIDHMEVDLEEECLKILALHQPVADHLRYIVAVLKLNNDLERIGDLAVNIAERAECIAPHRSLPIPFDYFTMAQTAQEMVAKSLDALVNRDLSLAYHVCAQDDDVDFMKRAMQSAFVSEIRKHPENAQLLTSLFLVSRHLERVADHATNIAEDVIYMISGQIHRHRGAEYK